jgi:hypothetical protein
VESTLERGTTTAVVSYGLLEHRYCIFGNEQELLLNRDYHPIFDTAVSRIVYKVLEYLSYRYVMLRARLRRLALSVY